MWAPGGSPGASGWDRRRVGARLRAALAGLYELQGLRATQQARVRGALAMQPPPGPAGPRAPRGRELRLEEALATLQEQLSRLRQQDTGLKTHLDQLDQQISQLQLGIYRSSGDAPDSDSRPSSGFYELSDAGSCSLSTSCASVCSDRLSPSLSSLLPASQPSRARPGMGDWRPRSADESTVPTWRPPPPEEGSRPTDRAEGTEQPRGIFRPRPVSTGDLERVLPANVGLPSTGTDATFTSLLCQGLDSTYQRDLVSRGGREVYPYPSPLHAVALQSPLFALTQETPQLGGSSPPRKPPLGPGSLNTSPSGPVQDVGPAEAYIDRLLRLRGRGSSLKGILGDQGPLRHEASSPPQQLCSQRQDNGSQPEKLVCAPERENIGVVTQSRTAHGEQGLTPFVDNSPPCSPPEEEPKPCHCCVHGETAVSLPPCPQAEKSHSDSSVSSPGSMAQESPPWVPKDSVHSSCATGEAFPLRLKTCLPQTKTTKIRRKASDKGLRPSRQPPLLPESHHEVHPAPLPSLEWDPWHQPQGAGLRKMPLLAREAPGRAWSESTLYPVPFFIPVVVAQRESHQAASHTLIPTEATPLGPATRRKQRQWRSSMEISGRAQPAGGMEPARPMARRAGGPQAQSRPMLARQDARSDSDPSEHSAEDASLFHSTIAETSGEEASDHTANCFGDRESSSSSDTDSGGIWGGANHRRGVPAWSRAGLQHPPRAPSGSRPPLPPVPKLCRIRASKALKKKIRRFQPAALKVMTMV
ncbi:dapper homolog 2 [Ctenodactylus gundi]